MADKKDAGAEGLTRRDFIRSSAGVAVGIAASRVALGGEGRPDGGDINIAMVGVGSQGRIITTNSCLKIPGVRFKAICDIWGHNQEYASNILKAYKQPVNVYVDYREMLDREKDLDAVFVATPDWKHAEHAIACLRAGKHVYCEKEMSNTLDGCRRMVRAAKKAGKLLQIGHQRRSNPRYLHADKLIHKDKILGRITHTYGQWNRAKRLDLGWPKKHVIDDATLRKYGYDTMDRFRNWRWYRKYAGGAIADLGSHQVDIFSWFLRCNPVAVLATGGLDYYKDKEWYDNVMAFYEYQTEEGTARSFYQVLNTTSFGGFYETFMGDEGSLQISENTKIGFFIREVHVKPKDWEEAADKVDKMGKKAYEFDIGATRKADGTKTPEALKMEADVKKPAHQPHLENFFGAIRNGTKLTCPAEVAFETAVPILKTNEAVEKQTRIELTAADYRV